MKFDFIDGIDIRGVRNAQIQFVAPFEQGENIVFAHELGIENDDVVKIISEAGEVEAPVYVYPAIHPEVIAMPFGQGHTAYGRYAQGRGANPADLLGSHFNEAGDLALAGMRVRVEKTGRKQILSRLESRIGVYGEGLGGETHR